MKKKNDTHFQCVFVRFFFFFIFNGLTACNTIEEEWEKLRGKKWRMKWKMDVCNILPFSSDIQISMTEKCLALLNNKATHQLLNVFLLPKTKNEKKKMNEQTKKLKRISNFIIIDFCGSV